MAKKKTCKKVPQPKVGDFGPDKKVNKLVKGGVPLPLAIMKK